jgi:iron complex outermembrane receptor protein
MSRRVVVPGLIGLCVAVGVQAAEHVPVIHVEGDLPGKLGESVEPREETVAPLDTGEWLRSLPGVSGTRLGGHGIDPVIRGQGETRVNVLLDGAYVHGGCPNRMDPATSYAPLTSYDKITLIRGNQTVRYGGGGSGGTLLLERDTPPFAAGEGPRLRGDGGYAGNGNRREAYVDGALGGEQGYARIVAGLNRADNYEDGDGNEVRSAFDERGANLLLGYTPNANTRLELGVEAVRGEDILYAGGMDAPKSDHDALRLNYVQRAEDPARGRVSTELYQSEVEHVMDNFSLRPLTAPMRMSVPSESTTRGGRAVYESGAAQDWLVGVDVQNNDREAIRYSGPTLAMINSYMWPDVTLDQWGVFGEVGFAPAPRQTLRAGLRYDRVDAAAGLADADPMGMPLSPNQLYALYYGETARDVTENNVGGFLRYEYAMHAPVTWSATLSRSVRTADATERFMAANGMTPDGRWVGNPGIDPEQHHQLELGADAKAGGWDLNGAVYADEVSDYILRDRAHAQDGILPNDSATVYRNVDARLYGTELGAARTWADVWQTRVTLEYVRGENRDEDRALAQIAPLELGLELRYVQSAWDLGGRLRVVDKQTRVDDDPVTGSGLDAGQTPGFAVLDLNGRYAFGKHVELKAGVDNVFDRTYAEHLNRSNDFDPVQVRINEPGRSVWLRLSAAL